MDRYDHLMLINSAVGAKDAGDATIVFDTPIVASPSKICLDKID